MLEVLPERNLITSVIRHGIDFAAEHNMAILSGKFFFTKGTGVHEKEMRAFEKALQNASVHTYNFIKTSR